MAALLVQALENALTEAFSYSSGLVPASLRQSFCLVGGAAMILHGRRRKTEDIDVACTTDAYMAFWEAMNKDGRYNVAADRKSISPKVASSP